MKCRACNNPTKEFFSLGAMPLVNFFLKKSQIGGEKKFDLTVAFCSKCYLAQLTKTISPKGLFEDYVYFSSVSKTVLDHAQNTAAYLTKRLKLDSNSLVFEIASNDGYLLQYFKQRGVKVLGIDPAKNIAEEANKRGIETIPEFFSYGYAKKSSKLSSEPKTIKRVSGRDAKRNRASPARRMIFLILSKFFIALYPYYFSHILQDL